MSNLKNGTYDNPKFQYIKKILTNIGKHESKKHGSYKILDCGIYKITYDSHNGHYDVHVNGSRVNLEEYLDIVYKAVSKKWTLPSVNEKKTIEDLLDYLYLKDENVREFYDNQFIS